MITCSDCEKEFECHVCDASWRLRADFIAHKMTKEADQFQKIMETRAAICERFEFCKKGRKTIG